MGVDEGVVFGTAGEGGRNLVCDVYHPPPSAAELAGSTAPRTGILVLYGGGKFNYALQSHNWSQGMILTTVGGGGLRLGGRGDQGPSSDEDVRGARVRGLCRGGLRVPALWP